MENSQQPLSPFNFLNKLFYDHETNRYGIISILIIIFGCGGGIAVGLGALESAFQLSVLVLTTMFALAMILAVAPMRIIVYATIFALICDIAIIIYNVIF